MSLVESVHKHCRDYVKNLPEIHHRTFLCQWFKMSNAPSPAKLGPKTFYLVKDSLIAPLALDAILFALEPVHPSEDQIMVKVMQRPTSAQLGANVCFLFWWELSTFEAKLRSSGSSTGHGTKYSRTLGTHLTGRGQMRKSPGGDWSESRRSRSRRR